MFRRSRLSIRPNVGTTGRTAATPQEAPPSNQEASEPPKDSSDKNDDTAGTDNKATVVQSEQTPPAGDSNDQNGESTTSSATLQRRKRFSIKPKVAPGRPAALPRTSKSPIKPVLQSHVEVPSSDLDKQTTSQVGTAASPQALLSPRQRRPSEESRQPKTQPKPTLTSSDSSETLSVPPEDSVEQIHLRTDGGKKESASASQVKEGSLRQPDKVPPSLPDKEAIEISEKAKTLVSSKSVISPSMSKFSLSRLLNDPSDLQRLEKAQKLRELLRQELNKEKKLKRAKACVKEYTLDPAKMTMRDLIHYLPLSNPMTSTLQESVQENETVVPQSPVREESPERAEEPQVHPKVVSPRQQGEGEEEEEEGQEVEAEAEVADDDQEEALMVPQVKVAEDGSLIIDEESLTVEVQRTKGPNPVQDRDPIFERGSTTTYASFRKGNYAKPWSSEETDMFFLAISMVGTDFTMICQLFPHRARSEIKNKFKKEERGNAWRIDKAFRERRRLDIEYFTKLLEKILEVQKNKKKLKSLSAKIKTPKPKRNRKPRGKKATTKLSDVEEENEDEDDEEEEGEKENEELCNEEGSPVSKRKRKCKRNDKGDTSPEQPDGKINKRGKKKNKQVEASVPTDTEAALPEDHTTSDQCDSPKDTAIKPAKLSRGRAPKLPLPMGLKRSKKPSSLSTKSKENTSDKGENMSEDASAEQVSKDASPSRQTNERESADENIESDEEFSVKPPRPTRYGRVPKLTQHLSYAAKEEAHFSASETAPASPAGNTASAAKAKPKSTAKRGRPARQQAAKESKKPKLITLRASQSEDSDDEPSMAEAIMGSTALSSSIDDGAAVFVPAGLCSPHPLVTEVEETMEELDILANMPDVLGISQDALCPEASCERAQNEAGTAEPCEHQLDLLVDVIDFMTSEHTEVSEDESYNEAAQTLLTIGNVAHLSHPSQNQVSMEDLPNISVIASESSHQEESQLIPDVQQETSTCPMSVASAHGITELSVTVGTMESESNTTEEQLPSQIDDTLITKPSEMYCEQKTETVSDSQLQSSPERSKETSSQTKKGRFSKIKPKPNIARASRTTQSNSQTDNNKVSLRAAEDHLSSASDIFQVSHLQQVPETISELQNSYPTVTGEISCTDVRLTAEPSGCQEAGHSVTLDQSTSVNQTSSIPETQLESSRKNQLTTELIDEKLPCPDRTCDISYSDPLTSNMVTGSASVYEGTDLVCFSPVNQKEETEVTNASEIVRGQFQEVQSTDSLLQASETEQPKTQTMEDPVTHLEQVDKPSIQTENPQPTEKPAEKMETEPTGNATLPETPSQSSGPDLVLVSSVNMDSTHKTAQKLCRTEEKKTDVEFTSQAGSCSESSEQNAPQRRRRFPKVKPKPNLGSSPRSTQSRAQLKCLSKSSNQLCKDSSLNATSEQQPIEENKAKTQVESAERDSQHLTPSHSSLNIELSSANPGNAEPEKSSGSTNEKDAQSDSIVMATSSLAESKTMFTDLVSENKTNPSPPVEQSTGGCISNQDKVETLDTGAASPCNTEQEINSRTAESNTQAVGDPSTVSNVQHSHAVSVLVTEAESIPENSQQPQTHCEIQSQDAEQHCSETSEKHQANKDKCPESLSETQDVPADSSKTSRKPLQTQRGRFIKPKPNLGRSGRPQRPQSKTENIADAGVCSNSADVSDSQKAVSELRSDIQETLEGAKEQVGGLDVPPSDAGSSTGDLPQVHDNLAQSVQDTTTSSTEETQNFQNLSIFQDILTEQVPSDPDEPFFILSLTAIPVCPSGEVLDTVSEPYLPVTDALAQQESSGPGETVTAGSEGSFANIHVPTSTEASNETDLISGNDIGPDPAVSASLLAERPENPQEGTSVQPPNLPDTTENIQESDDPPKKRSQTGRRAKLQVKPQTARNRQARNKESLTAKEANKPLQTNTTQDPEIPGPSVQPEATNSTAKTSSEIIVIEPEEESGDDRVTEKSRKAVEDRSSGAQNQKTESRGKGQTRKSKYVLPGISEKNSIEQASNPPQAKASTRCSKVKAPCTARSTTPPAVASTSHDVTYSTVPEETHSTVSTTPPSQIQMDVQQSEDHSQLLSDTTPSTSQCTAEDLSTQESDWMENSQVDDEPTSVSQYFLSDIFTAVEDE